MGFLDFLISIVLKAKYIQLKIFDIWYKKLRDLLSFLSACFGFSCHRQQKCHAAAPAPAGVRRRMGINRQKLVGRDKGSLTEQQTKGTGTTTIQIRGIHKTKQTAQKSCSPELDQHCALPSRKWVPTAPLPPPRCRGEWKETCRNWWVGIRAV